MHLTPVRWLQLVGSCLVLGLGAALMLSASLGSDGYSTLINGLTISTGLPFVVSSVAVGATFVGIAWLRGLTPGVGTLVQPVVVGATVGLLLGALPTSDSLWVRVGVTLAGFVAMDLGVAGYLGTRSGAGPAEGPALAFDPPVPFTWSYTAIQLGGALVGWLLGASIGFATVLVIVALGPAVDRTGRALPFLGKPQTREDQSSPPPKSMAE